MCFEEYRVRIKFFFILFLNIKIYTESLSYFIYMNVFITVGKTGTSLAPPPGIDPIDRVSYLPVPYIFHTLPHGSGPCSAVIHHDLFAVCGPFGCHFFSVNQVLCLMILF